MTDEKTKTIVTINDLPPEIIETLFPFQDFVSLKSCRLVCKSWEILSRPEMMKRSAINPCKMDRYRIEDQERAGLFSSWKINYPSLFFRSFLPLSNLDGRQVKYVKILLTLPFTEGFCLWLQRLLTIHCPNIEELALDFEFKEWGNKEFSIQDFITDYACLPLIRTLRFLRITYPASCEFAMTIVAACPNLEHLYFTKMARSHLFAKDEEAYILYRLTEEDDESESTDDDESESTDDEEDYVVKQFDEGNISSRHAKLPEVIKKLKTMEWTLKEGSDYRDIDGYIPPVLKFSENLQRLHWDVMRIEGGQNGGLVPLGVLKRIAGSLRELSVRRCFCVNKSPIESLGLPVLQTLSKLQIGIEAYATVALSELVDAAPNLTRLEIIDDKEYRKSRLSTNNLWGTSPKEMKPHPNLKTFVTEVGFEELPVFEKTLKKFPNLKKLYVGACYLELSGTFNALKNNACQLEHLYWVTLGKLDLSQLCDHLVLDVAKVSSWGNLKYYYFEYAGNQGHHFIDISEYQQSKEEIWQGMK
jgi:hypothetical protein